MIRLNKSVLRSDVDGEIMLLDRSSGVYYGFNEVGRRMLELAMGMDDQEMIIATLTGEFDEREEIIRRDFCTLIATLLSKGLIVNDEQ
ncbi:MAG: PqqD family protein [Spirochaetes bacterium]|nr:PqqD family protein [Spirochaetota bacterium]